MKKCGFLLLFIFANLACKAQDTINLDLNFCLTKAIDQSPEYQISELSYHKAQKTLNSLVHNMLPGLYFSNDLFYREGKSINIYTNQFESLPVTSNSTSLTGRLELFRGFSQVYKIKQQKKLIELQSLSRKRNYQDLTLETLEDYFRILSIDEKLTIAHSHLKTTEAQIAHYKKLVNYGKNLEHDLLKLKARESSERFLIIQAETERKQAMRRLLNRLGLKEDSSKVYQLKNIRTAPELSADSIKNISANRLENISTGQYAALEKQKLIEAYDDLIKSIQGTRLPTISLAGGLSTNYSSIAPDSIPVQGEPGRLETNTFRNQMKNNLQEYVGLSLNIPISNSYQRKNEIQIAKIDQSIQQEQLKIIQRDGYMKLSILKEEIELLDIQLNMKKEELSYSKEILRVMETYLSEGEVLFAEYFQYKDQYFSDQTEYAGIQNRLKLKLIQLEFFMNPDKPITL